MGGRGIERIATRSFNWKNYCIDRFARIFPPLLGALLFCYLFSVICYGRMPSTLSYVGNLLSLQGIFVSVISGPFWSLAYEVWFYIILGGVSIYFCSVENRSKILLFPLLGFSAFVFTRLSVVYLFVWCIGTLAYFIRFHKIKKCYCIMITGLLVAVAGFRQMTSGSRAFDILSQVPSSVGILLFALFGALFLAMVASVYSSGKASILISLVGRKLAAFSYTLYLTHYMTFRILEYCGLERAKTLSLKSLSISITTVIIAMVVAYLLYLPFEKQTAHIKTWLKKIWNIRA